MAEPCKLWGPEGAPKGPYPREFYSSFMTFWGKRPSKYCPKILSFQILKLLFSFFTGVHKNAETVVISQLLFLSFYPLIYSFLHLHSYFNCFFYSSSFRMFCRFKIFSIWSASSCSIFVLANTDTCVHTPTDWLNLCFVFWVCFALPFVCHPSSVPFHLLPLLLETIMLLIEYVTLLFGVSDSVSKAYHFSPSFPLSVI